jgi:hypothetical protein
MTTTVRTVNCSVTFGGNSLSDVIQARGQVSADTGWPTCSVFVTAKPTVGDEDDDLHVDAGAGNNVRRFTGVLRQFRTSGFPKSLELVCMGTLAYADDWAPEKDMVYDPDSSGFVAMEEGDTADGMFGVTDQVLVRAVLDQVPDITYTSGDIGGSGVSLGEEAPDAFIWGKGTSAWRYIQQLDSVTHYRTYQDRNGAIKRVQMVGHPSGSPSFTLDDDDVLDSATGGRDTLRTRSGVLVTGHDYGDGEGPVKGNDTGSFRDWETRWEKFSSDMIESGNDPDTGTADGRGGLNAGAVATVVLGDVLKEFVDATVPTWRDDTAEPGQTILLDCLNRLAIGENMWVQGYAWEVNDNFTATFTLSGGGT